MHTMPCSKASLKCIAHASSETDLALKRGGLQVHTMPCSKVSLKCIARASSETDLVLKRGAFKCTRCLAARPP